MKKNDLLAIPLRCLVLPALGILLAYMPAAAQSLRKYPIQQSGCSYYNYCDAPWDVSSSPDSSLVFTGECLYDEFHYAVICVRLKESFGDLPVAEEVLESYLNHLKTIFDITQATGYGRGHRLLQSEQTRGLLDYWKDKKGNNWKVKGWTNDKFLGVLMVYGPREIPEARANAFLDGFRFPD